MATAKTSSLAQRAREELQRRAALAELARRSFAEFVRQGWSLLEPNGRPFIDNLGTRAIIDHLQAVGDGRIKRLLIAIPPGFGKSTFASIGFPAWMWARNPSWRVICASHAHMLALQIAGRARRLIESDWYRESFGVELVTERMDAFENAASGRRYSVGVEGALTGLRGDAAIIDDALNAVDRFSAAALAAANDWFDSALVNRLDRGDDAPIIVIGQRLGEDDLIGHLIRRGGWEVLSLPAEFERDHRCVTSIWQDPRTEDGELLAPGIQSAAYLAEMKRTLLAYGYAAQFQQRPAPLEGGVLQRSWWRWFREADGRLVSQRPKGARAGDAMLLPEMREVIVSCDLGFKGGKEHDNTAMMVVGSNGPDRFVLDLVARPMEFLEQIAELRALRTRWPQARRVLVEDSANAASLMSTLKGEMSGLVPVATGSDKKEWRIMSVAPELHGGNVYLRDGAPWADDLVEEAAVFPSGRRDDRLDALAQALKHFDTSGIERVRKLSQLGGALARELGGFGR